MMRGGKREGSGRPYADERMKKEPYSTRLPAWLLEWMREQAEPGAVLIEQALRKAFKLKPPKD